MSKGIIAVIDSNQTYCCNLCEYIDSHLHLGFTTAWFSSISDFIIFPYKCDVQFLFIRDCFVDELLEFFDFSMTSNDTSFIYHTYVLSDSRYCEDIAVPSLSDVKIKSIYLYQSAKDICKIIYESADCVAIRHCIDSTASTRVYGVYSPVKRSGRTSFAMTLAMVLSLNSPTLFISFDEYCDEYLSSHFTAKTISDVMINFIEHPDGLCNHILENKTSINGLDILLPPKYCQDIRTLSTDDIEKFVDGLTNSSYTNIIIDFADTSQNIVSLLLHCHKIYMPVVNDDISQSKIKSFMNNSSQINSTFSTLNIEEVSVPIMDYKHNETEYINQLMISPISGYINEILNN